MTGETRPQQVDVDRLENDPAYRDGVTDLSNEILWGVPESWDGDGSVLIEYVETIERRLVERGGSLERWEE